ncbi:Lyso-phosphatidylcholine acyltransferase [Collariella sp. IMI 366227]|nr:Lyso-phosphatidylcholine acyltransferase [Collariella sp. IMI 366227]
MSDPVSPSHQRPSLSWRIKSAMIMGMTGVLSRVFLYGFNKVEVTGLDRFLAILDSRKDPANRKRGLLTVWGILPLRYSFDPSNLRWTLGAADICFANNWVHVFPEGCVHQHASTDLRYFKWGLARLILESDPAPDVLPMFIDGTQRVMHEDRGFPRFLPRVGRTVRVAFGEVLDYEGCLGI